MFTRLLAAALVALAATAEPAAAAVSPAWRPCLECHAEAGLELKAANGEVLPLTVSAAELSASAHHGLECRACHAGVQLDNHPGAAAVPSLAAYRAGATRVCLGCHDPEKLRGKGAHAGVVFEDQSLSCVGCHGSHGVRPVTAWKSGVTPNDYCLGCHARAMTMKLAGGETLALQVDGAKLKASVHPNHACTDCHGGFSKSAHPSAASGSRRDRAVAAARVCARCHADKLKQVEGSVHYTLLRSGAQGVPGCVDCHSAHEVAPTERFATLAGTPCRGCHAKIFEAFSGSMHAKVRTAGEHLDAPLCSDCHRAHDVQGTASPAAVKAACIGCHQTAASLHAVWLPNAGLHLDMVSCAACHAPAARRVVTLRLVEEGSGRTLTQREIGDLLGPEAARSLEGAAPGLDGMGLWNLMRRIEKLRGESAAKISIAGRLDVARGADAHRLADKTGAVRACQSCHESGSPIFDSVVLSVSGPDGRPQSIDAAPGVLTDAGSMLAVPRFYALGGTRQVILDWLLLLAVAGGLGVIAVHLTARLLSARSRKEG
jgi:hypothetical protein